MRILVVRPGAIGDALLAFPVIGMMREQAASPHVTLVSNAAVLPQAQAFGLAEAVSQYDHPQWSELFSSSGIASPFLRELLGHMDCAICWLRDDEGIVQRNLRQAGVNAVTVRPGRPAREQEQLHQTVYLAQTLGLPPIDITAPFVPPTPLPPPHPTGAMNCAPTYSASNISTVGVGWRNTVAVHPGSGGAGKCWPIAHFTGLINRLRARHVPVLLLAGPADHERLDAILHGLDGDAQGAPLHTLVNAPLLEVAHRLQQCGCYVGNDSGLTHLSALLGIPTIAIFGPTDPARWRPIGPAVIIARAQPLERLSVDEIVGLIETSSPFSLDRRDPI